MAKRNKPIDEDEIGDDVREWKEMRRRGKFREREEDERCNLGSGVENGNSVTRP